MELKTCEYCGTAYDARLRQCPLCGRTAEGPAAPAEPERTSPVPGKVRAERPCGASRAGQTSAAGCRRAEGGQRLRGQAPAHRVRAPAVRRAERTRRSRLRHPQVDDDGSVRDPRRAVLGGALLAFSRLGWSPLYREPALEAPVQPAEPAQPEPEQTTVQPPAEPAQPDENRYMNEEDQKHDQTPEPEQNESSVSCTSLTLSAPTVTFEEAGRFFNITFTRTPADCTEPVAFSSSDETVATVSEQGKIIAVNAGLRRYHGPVR